MDPRSTQTPDDISSTVEEFSSTTNNSVNTTATPVNETIEMKRNAAKLLIERYFYQLQNGCGNTNCTNKYCFSSGQVPVMTANDIAAKAIQLFSQDAQLCDVNSAPIKVARTQNGSSNSSHLVNTDKTVAASTSFQNDSGTVTSSGSSSSSCSSSRSSNNTSLNNVTIYHNKLAETLNSTKMSSLKIAPDASMEPSAQLPLMFVVFDLANIDYLNEDIFNDIFKKCKTSSSYEPLSHVLTDIFTNIDKLSQSFRRQAKRPINVDDFIVNSKAKLQAILNKRSCDLKKEDLRTLEGETDKDEDSTCAILHSQSDELVDTEGEINSGASNGGGGDEDEPISEVEIETSSSNSADVQTCNFELTVDLESVRRIIKNICEIENTALTDIVDSYTSATIQLAEIIKCKYNALSWEKVLDCLIICFDIATNSSFSPDANKFTELIFLERSIPKLCEAVYMLPVKAHACLARLWATHLKCQLPLLVLCCQHLITVRVVLEQEYAQDNADVIALTKFLKIIFYSNLLTDKVEKSSTRFVCETEMVSLEACSSGTTLTDDDDLFYYMQSPKLIKMVDDKLEKELHVNVMECREPLVNFKDFYNEPLSEAIQMDRDYYSYKQIISGPSENNFSFMLHSYILTPAAKVIALYYDCRIRMHSERNSSIYYSLLSYLGDNSDQPDLKLKVRRDNIIQDALVGLEMVAMSNPKDLKKQLVVEFVGEQGIDEGGVSKEFFQLVVEELFNPDFGMFIHQEETNTVWFNLVPFENNAQFTLIGIILGLAIYNNIILSVNFPMIVYRKLMGCRGTFHDLIDWNPTLYQSFKAMLDYTGPDMEETFMQTFKINYNNVFGEAVDYELKKGGGEINVGQHNKQEFIDLYTDFLLNKSIERQFKAFKKGFEMVTDESPLKLLFRPEEIELLVCGSRKFDFHELEKSTEYEGGYTSESETIKNFWSIVHAMSEDYKRKLLEFTTGSDRVPVGGLSHLKLLITRNGPDTDRLPTSHTCFNVLLLPEYGTKEKLEERLLKAINYSKGFGML